MSRYVSVHLALDLDETIAALEHVGLAVHRADDRVMLRGTLECPGEPVHARIEEGPFDTIEDFGFVRDDNGVRLVCGELDRGRLERDLLPKLRAEVARARVQRAAEETGMTTEETIEADGTRRIKVRRG
jgi:hypothetical protein